MDTSGEWSDNSIVQPPRTVEARSLAYIFDINAAVELGLEV